MTFGALAGCVAAMYVVSGVAPTFVPALTGSRGLRGQTIERAETQAAGAQTSGALAAGVAAVACGIAAVRRGRAAAAPRTQVHYGREDSGLTGGGPVVALANALLTAQTKSPDPAKVSEDVFTALEYLKKDEFLNEWRYIINNNDQYTLVAKAQKFTEMVPLKSETVKKFIIYLAKKDRFEQLEKTLREYVTLLYEKSSLCPVKIISATKLSEEQLATIEKKLKVTAGAKELLIMTEVRPQILGGLKIEWNFVDLEKFLGPQQIIDLTLDTQIQKVALREGVPLDMN